MAIEHKKVFKEYSDLPENSFSQLCYSLSEVLIEKATALMGTWGTPKTWKRC